MAQARIIATDENIREIVKSEINRLGDQADLNHVDVSNVTDMSFMFYESKFNGDISKWDVSKVKNMAGMFTGSEFNGDISGWDVSNVRNMKGLFYYSQFNGDISNWDVSNVESMLQMFKTSKFDGNISQWDVSGVKYMHYMFADSRFNGDISQWDVSNVKDMSFMFYESKFNGDISEWDVSKVGNMDYIFSESKFNGDISKWNVRDDCSVDRALRFNSSLKSGDFGKLHFMAKAQDESIVLHPDAEAAYAASMPIAKAMYPNEPPSVRGAMAWEAYQASQSQGATDSYDYTAALDACDFSSTAESEYTR